MLEDPDWIVVNVRADPDLAGEALRRATPDLLALDGGWESAQGLSPGMSNNPKGVFGVTYMPDGAFVVVDGGEVPDKMLARIPEVVSRHLAEVGVEDAVIGEPLRQGGPISNIGMDYVTRTVAAHLIASPPDHNTRLPEGWAEAACEWVRRGLPDDHPLWSTAGFVCSVLAGDVPTLMEQARRRRSDCRFVAGRPASWPSGKRYPPPGWTYERIQDDAAERLGGRFRAAWVSFGNQIATTQIVLGGGGPASSDEDLVVLANELTALARHFSADLAYAYVDTGMGFGAGSAPYTEWSDSGGTATYHLHRVCDEVAFDAYPFQVLSPGHLARLGGTLPGAERLAGGRVGLAIGEFADWQLGPFDPANPRRSLSERMRDPTVRQRGWELLRPCLLTDADPTPYRPPPAAKESRQ